MPIWREKIVPAETVTVEGKRRHVHRKKPASEACTCGMCRQLWSGPGVWKRGETSAVVNTVRAQRCGGTITFNLTTLEGVTARPPLGKGPGSGAAEATSQSPERGGGGAYSATCCSPLWLITQGRSRSAHAETGTGRKLGSSPPSIDGGVGGYFGTE